jgi:Ca2+/Na+ antiporter
MTQILALLLQDSGGTGAALFGSAFTLIILAVGVICLVGMWKVFTKAGQPGWACIIPIYNIYVLLQIAGRPAWWLVLFFIPVVSLVAWIIVAIDVAKAFGQSTAWGVVMLVLLSFIGFLMLGFGNYRYIGPGGLMRSRAAAGM